MTTLRITNEDPSTTVDVLVFDNGSQAGDATSIPPGEARAVYVTPTRKLVITQSAIDALRGVPVEKVPALADRVVQSPDPSKSNVPFGPPDPRPPADAPDAGKPVSAASFGTPPAPLESGHAEPDAKKVHSKSTR